MPRIVMLSGVPGSGKSAYRRNLLAQSSAQAMVISSDEWLMHWAREEGITYTESSARFRERAVVEILNQIAHGIAANIDMIWDQPNLTAEARQERLAQFPDHYERIAVAFETPRDLAMERLKDRKLHTGVHITEVMLDRQIRDYQRPHFDEGFDSIVLISEPGPKIQVICG